jgi:translin
VTTDRSDEITAAGEAARKVLEEKHLAREITLNASRRAIRACASAIRAVQRREFYPARELTAEAAAFLAEADAALTGHPDVRYAGSLHDAKKEFAEANLTLAFVSGQALPRPEELRVEMPAYLNGLAEAASEVRRQVLDCLRREDLAEAEGLLAVMDEVYGVLVTVDYPDALTGGLPPTRCAQCSSAPGAT